MHGMKGHKMGYGMDEMMDVERSEASSSGSTNKEGMKQRAIAMLEDAKSLMSQCGMDPKEGIAQVFEGAEAEDDSPEHEMAEGEAPEAAEDQSDGKKALIVAMLKKKNAEMGA